MDGQAERPSRTAGSQWDLRLLFLEIVVSQDHWDIRKDTNICSTYRGGIRTVSSKPGIQSQYGHLMFLFFIFFISRLLKGRDLAIPVI